VANARVIDTRSRILQAAAKTFAARGFRAATMKQIASEADVNDITVYRHFPKKQQLYWAAIEWKIQSSALNEIVTVCLSGSGSPRFMLRVLGERLLEIFVNDASLGRLIYFASLELPEEKKKLHEKLLKPLLNSLETVIESWVETGEIRNVNPYSAALAIIGMIWSPYNLREVFGIEMRTPESVKFVAEEFAEMCIQGLTVQTPRASLKT
jgi:AcrR family transcriptional regulator